MINYSANCETAKTYIKAGLNDTAYEYLIDTLKSVPKKERTGENRAFLEIITFLAQLELFKDRKKNAIKRIEQGLKLNPNHIDLLFLKTLYLWNEKRYDDMFVVLMHYLMGILLNQHTPTQYNYASKHAQKEIIEKLLPDAYYGSNNRLEFSQAIRHMAARSKHEFFTELATLIQSMDQVEKKNNPTPHEQQN